MKKTLAIVMVIVLSLCLFTACKEKPGTSSNASQQGTGSSAATAVRLDKVTKINPGIKGIPEDAAVAIGLHSYDVVLKDPAPFTAAWTASYCDVSKTEFQDYVKYFEGLSPESKEGSASDNDVVFVFSWGRVSIRYNPNPNTDEDVQLTVQWGVF